MRKIASDETKEISVERWGEWCDLFTNGNCGRLVGIETVDDELGTETLTTGVALVAVDCDPEGKGNDFVISFGDEEPPLWPGDDTLLALLCRIRWSKSYESCSGYLAFDCL